MVFSNKVVNILLILHLSAKKEPWQSKALFMCFLLRFKFNTPFCLCSIEGFINFKKPISKLCFFAALIPAGLKMLSRLYYDIFVWGLPQEIEEWLLVSTYYVGDIASFFIGYFALLYVLQLFYTDETKRRIDFES